LAVAVAALAGKLDWISQWSESKQVELLERIVERGPAVDGAARAFRPTVDGLDHDSYFGPWRSMERVLHRLRR
jgi:hypothetical protein